MPKLPKTNLPIEPAKPIEFTISKLHYSAHTSRTENCMLFAQPNVLLKIGTNLIMSNEGLVRTKNLVVREVRHVKIHIHYDLVWIWINKRNLHQKEVLAFANMLGYASKVELAQAYIDTRDPINFEWVGQLFYF